MCGTEDAGLVMPPWQAWDADMSCLSDAEVTVRPIIVGGVGDIAATVAAWIRGEDL